MPTDTATPPGSHYKLIPSLYNGGENMTKHHCYVFKKITDDEDPSNDELKLMCSLRGTESEVKQLVELLNKMNCNDFVKYEVDLEVQDGEGVYDQLQL